MKESDAYIAGSLRHAPREWWGLYERIGDVARALGLEPHVPHVHTVNTLGQKLEDLHDPNLDLKTRARAYQENVEAIRRSRLVIAEVTKPSTGTGFEVALAVLEGKPLICLAHKDADVTSMVLGPGHLGLLTMIRYESEEDGLRQLAGAIRELIASGKIEG